MGQGLSCGAMAGIGTSAAISGVVENGWIYGQVICATTAAGFAVDFISDATARVGKAEIERQVILNASDSLKHVYTYYARNDSHPVSRLVRQKHEWIVLESHTHKFYTVQKSPKTGDVLINYASTLRAANDAGLSAASRPLAMGEIRQHRQDMDFDVPEDLQVAYIIAWLRKEDPRWAFSTENSKHFTTRLRYALHDF